MRPSADRVDERREPLRFDRMTIDTDQRIVEVDDAPADLTALQFDLLVALAESPGRVFTRLQLIERVWGQRLCSDEGS